MVDKELNNLMQLIPFTLRKAIITRIESLDPRASRFFDRTGFDRSTLNSFIVAEKIPALVISVCDEIFGIDVQSRRRFRDICELRQAAIWIIRSCTQGRITMKVVGSHFGGIDHSAVHASIHKCEDLMITSRDYRKKMYLLCSALCDKGYVDGMIEFMKFLNRHDKDLPENAVISNSVKEILEKELLIEKEYDRDPVQNP